MCLGLPQNLADGADNMCEFDTTFLKPPSKAHSVAESGSTACPASEDGSSPERPSLDAESDGTSVAAAKPACATGVDGRVWPRRQRLGRGTTPRRPAACGPDELEDLRIRHRQCLEALQQQVASTGFSREVSCDSDGPFSRLVSCHSNAASTVLEMPADAKHTALYDKDDEAEPCKAREPTQALVDDGRRADWRETGCRLHTTHAKQELAEVTLTAEAVYGKAELPIMLMQLANNHLVQLRELRTLREGLASRDQYEALVAEHAVLGAEHEALQADRDARRAVGAELQAELLRLRQAVAAHGQGPSAGLLPLGLAAALGAAAASAVVLRLGRSQ